MMTERIYPWTLVPLDTGENLNLAWAVSYIRERKVSDFIWDHIPDALTLSRIDKLIHSLTGNRNWIVCLSSSPSYMRILYMYLVSVWSLNTGKRFRIADLVELVSASMDGTLIEEYETADLLIIPYGDPNMPGIQKVRGSVYTLLQRRKVQELPTLVEVYVADPPKDQDSVLSNMGFLVDLFGELATDLFSGAHVKYVSLGDVK